MSIDLSDLLAKFLHEPIIVTSTRSQHVDLGKTVALIVAAIGWPQMTYQWKKNGVVITGIDHCALLLLRKVSVIDAGDYTCTVTNKYGSTVSPVCRLDVHAMPFVLVQPVAVTIDEATALTLSVVVAGSLPISYQWQKNGIDIIGAISSTYTKASSEVQDTGFYSCKAVNQYGLVTSKSVAVIVNQVGFAPKIDVQPIGSSIFDGGSFYLSVVASGTIPLSYQWKKNGSIITGAIENFYAKNGAVMSDSGSYTCVVTNNNGSVESVAAVISVVGVAPIIDEQPQDVTIYDGGDFSLSVTVHGTIPLSYQWKKNGSIIGGATSATYIKTNAVMSDSGSYTCVVTNVIASTETIAVAVVVQGVIPVIDTQPQDVTIYDGGDFSLSVTAHGTSPLSYQWTKNNVDIGGATSSTFTKSPAGMTDTASYACIVSNIAGSTSTDEVIVTVQGVVPIIDEQPQNVTIYDGGNFSLSVTAHGTSPLSYQWKKNNIDIGGATNSTYSKVGALISDSAHYVCEVSNIIGTTRTNIAVVTVQAIVPTIQVQPKDVTIDDNEIFTLTIAATGTLPLLYQWKKNDIDILGANSAIYSKVSVMSDLGSYTCVVTNAGGSITSDAAAVVVVGVAAEVVSIEPDSVAIVDGENFTLTVAAIGTPVLTYQWKKGLSNIPGATLSVYNKVGALMTDSGSYTCVVTNDYGTDTSAAVIVAVAGIAPVIDDQPQGVSIVDGEDFTLSITAHGTIPLAYQWKKGGVVIEGATNSTYSKVCALITDSGSYTCVVTNVVDSITSSAAIVTVAGIAPVIMSMTGPQGNEVWQDIGTAFTIILVAAGTEPLSYQWRVDFTGTENDDGLGIRDIVGAIDTVYSVTNAQKTVSGFYSCKVTNVFGVATSYSMLVNIGQVPMVISNPENVTVDERQSFQLVSQARGAFLKFQWTINSLPVGSFESVTLDGHAIFTKQAEVSDFGVYSCRFVSCLENGDIPVDAKYAYSKAVIVLVTEIGFAPEITIQPVGVQIPKPGVVITGGQTGIAEVGTVQQTIAMSSLGDYQTIFSNSNYAQFSSNFGATWVARRIGPYWNQSVSVSGSGQYQTSFATEGRGLYVSANYGVSWALKTTTEVTNPYIRSSSMDNSGQYQLVLNEIYGTAGAWLSRDYGNTWTKVVAQGGWGATAISANGQYMAVALAAVGFWRSTDYGITWTKLVNSPSYNAYQFRSLALSYDGRIWYWVGQNSNVFASSDYGASFYVHSASPAGITWLRLRCSIDGKVIVGAAAGRPIYFSRDYGATYNILPGSEGKEWSDIAISADGSRITGVMTNANIYVFTIYESPISFTVSLTVIGTPPLSYQWEKEGIIVPDATQYFYYKNSAQPSDLGNYTCVVTNNYGEIESDIARVEMVP